MAEVDQKTLKKQMKEQKREERRRIRQKQKEILKGDRVGFFADFKKFITKGNVLDMAVAVVIASAFNAIVNGLVKNIITPCITYFTSGVSINEWEYVLREASEKVVDGEVVELAKISIQYGLWLQAIVDFLIIALSVFVAVRVIRKAERAMNAKKLIEEEEAAAKKKAEEDAKAAAAAEAAATAAAEEKAALAEFYANVKEQSELLRDIRESLKK